MIFSHFTPLGDLLVINKRIADNKEKKRREEVMIVIDFSSNIEQFHDRENN